MLLRDFIIWWCWKVGLVASRDFPHLTGQAPAFSAARAGNDHIPLLINVYEKTHLQLLMLCDQEISGIGDRSGARPTCWYPVRSPRAWPAHLVPGSVLWWAAGAPSSASVPYRAVQRW